MLLNCGVEKTLESPLDCKEIHQSILKEISPGCSLKGLILKLKLQYFCHLMQRAGLLEKTLILGKLKAGREGDRRLDGITDSTDMHLGKLGDGEGQGSLECCPGVAKSQTGLGD